MSILEVSKEEIIGWLCEHEQAFKDFCDHFNIDEADAWFEVGACHKISNDHQNDDERG